MVDPVSAPSVKIIWTKFQTFPTPKFMLASRNLIIKLVPNAIESLILVPPIGLIYSNKLGN